MDAIGFSCVIDMLWVYKLVFDVARIDWGFFHSRIGTQEMMKHVLHSSGVKRTEVANDSVRRLDLNAGLYNWLVVWNISFIFPYIGNNHPNWLSYFSEGFKPPTSYINNGFCYRISSLNLLQGKDVFEKILAHAGDVSTCWTVHPKPSQNSGVITISRLVTILKVSPLFWTLNTLRSTSSKPATEPLTRGLKRCTGNHAWVDTLKGMHQPPSK